MALCVGNITAILISLKIGREQSLFLRLTSDGEIDRRGTGSEDDPDEVLCRGRIDPSVFAALRDEITAPLWAWFGNAHTEPNPRGKKCQLLIGFKTTSGGEHLAAWEYGSKSFTPPEEVYDFVMVAVRLTDPWWEAVRANQQTSTRE